MFEFMDIRRAAIINCTAGVLSLLIPAWNAALTMAALESTHPRWWITAAVMGALFTAIMPVLAPNRGTWTARDISGAFGILSCAASILMMISIYRHVSENPDDFAPVSKFLRIATRAAIIVWGIWVAFHFCRLVLTPYTYATIRAVAMQRGQTPPSFRDVLAEAAQTLLSQAGLFAGPFIIWRSSSPPTNGNHAIEVPTTAPTDLLSR